MDQITARRGKEAKVALPDSCLIHVCFSANDVQKRNRKKNKEEEEGEEEAETKEE